MATLVLDNLHLWYGKTTHAVDGVSLRVGDGEFVVLLGPSGCGKTSTLRMIAGLERPSSGRVVLDGRVINDLYPGERGIAMVFQSYALSPHMTVREHFALPLIAQRVPASQQRQRIERIAELLHMHELLDRYPRELSSGQAQRVAIGRALIREPRLLLLDEPLTNLDAQLRLETRAALKRLQTDLGITTIYVTHDQEEAQSLADRIVVMDAGRVQQDGSPRAVYDAPANLFVAGFIGTPPMNFATGELRRSNGALWLEAPALRLRLPATANARLSEVTDGQRLIAGVRPEDIRLAITPDGAQPRGTVFVVEPQGDERIVSLRLGDLLWKVRVPRAALTATLHADQEVGIAIPPERVHLFDAETQAGLL